MTPEQIRMIRVVHGMTQKEFADRVRISQPLTCAIERGERNITDRTREKIIEALGLDEEKLNEIKRLKGLFKNDGAVPNKSNENG